MDAYRNRYIDTAARKSAILVGFSGAYYAACLNTLYED
jgi:hypothetical protein